MLEVEFNEEILLKTDPLKNLIDTMIEFLVEKATFV
jgi:hypothetical protein